jgi:hypothetical protein
VSISRSNQEEIFKTLSQHDFKKILTNLEDTNESTVSDINGRVKENYVNPVGRITV